MKEQTLCDLGLSKNESRIYLSLLETGSATITQVADASGVHRVNVYDSLHRLKERGLVGEIQHDGKRFYQAAPPETLRGIIREKETKLNSILPQLELFTKLNEKKHDVQVFEGMHAVRNLFLHFLELKEEIYDLHVPSFSVSRIGVDWQNAFHKRRIQQKQWMHHIYNKNAHERIQAMQQLPYTTVRCLDLSYDHAVSTLVCGEVVAVRMYYDEEGTKPLLVMIRNPQIARAFRDHFGIIWKYAKEVGAGPAVAEPAAVGYANAKQEERKTAQISKQVNRAVGKGAKGKVRVNQTNKLGTMPAGDIPAGNGQ